jgi:hypothetical protein
MHAPVAGDDAVARHELPGHSEILAAVGDERVDFLERALVEEQVDALARGQLARLALAAQPLLAPAERGATAPAGQCGLGIHVMQRGPGAGRSG